MNLVLFPAQVQGDGAAEDIVRGIEALGKLPGISVIIVGRGGGSMEDLWAFNEEIVARAIAACPVPVVSAVGHETDFTIADFVADVRASTPSAAAEMTVPILDDLVFTVNELKRRMLGGGEKTLLQNRERLLKTVNRLQTLHPKAQVQAAQSRADLLCSRLKNAAAAYVALKESRYNAVQAKFTALGPMQVMKRGYALALKDGVPVTGVKAIVPGDRLRVLFSDGQVLANALETKEGNPFE
jgi:exodeoxyribonuclease VII large subunit